jgi:hypothetical protein
LFRYIAAVAPEAMPGRTIQGDRVPHEVVSGILLEDVKQRLLRRLQAGIRAPAPLNFDERVF